MAGLTRREQEELRIEQQLLDAAKQDGVEISQATIDQVIAEKRAYEEAARAAQTFALGVRRGWEDIVDSIATNADVAQEIVTDLFDGFTTLISDFVKTGEFKWRDFLTGILGRLSEFFAQRLVIDVLGINGNFTGGTGGLGTTDLVGSIAQAAGGLFGGARAAGGPVSRNTPYLVGERGPELFMPNQGGQIRSTEDTVAALRLLAAGRDDASQSDFSETRPNVTFNISTPDVEGFRKSQGQMAAEMNAMLERAGRRNN